MSKRNALFYIAASIVVAIAAVNVIVSSEPAPEAPAIIEVLPPTPTPHIEYVVTAPAPLWNTATHEKEYCEGFYPYFTDYTEREFPFTESDIEMLAKTVWGEARGCSPDEWRLVVWTVLQRVDAIKYGDTIEAVITAPRQFVGYRPGHPIDPYIYELVTAELMKWVQGEEPPTHEIFAPTLPYFYFDGDGTNNWFREAWR